MPSESRALVPFSYSDEDQNLPLAFVGPHGRQIIHSTFGPGRLLNQAYISVGKSIEKRANKFAHQVGLGPIAVTEKIEKAFETALEGREAKLDDLHDRLGSGDDRSVRELQRYCMKLMKYALP